MFLCPVLDNSIATTTVTAVSQQFGAMTAPTIESVSPSAISTPVQASSYYAYSCNVGSWIAQGANPTSTVNGAGCMFVPANTLIPIDPKYGAKLSVLRDGAVSGNATLARARKV